MTLRCVRGTRECSAPISPASLRAQRSNPESHRGKTLDCFAALAMTRGDSAVLQLTLSTPQTRGS
ncbi:hypothetical protein DAA53_27165 [Bradyrhizobium sp. WBAH23]|nr:hypothetical protein DAA53_27165 [Bradyrhizobium sp. WBAH23]QCJ91766.1 hypothetical protein DAA57_27240 [Bradyrhizobium yuanmingense]QCJ99156.1 hypothetical protein DAA61_27120 [Bradyrhizobium sp. WBAH33]QCK06526.1 hypothetical protein DAB18_27160 [Bradyrhizobium sp. WBAH41]